MTGQHSNLLANLVPNRWLECARIDGGNRSGRRKQLWALDIRRSGVRAVHVVECGALCSASVIGGVVSDLEILDRSNRG